jgi:macrolide transport system ATP-binding/permease protein
MHRPNAFELKNVTYTYRAASAPEFTALRNLNLTIAQGDFVAIIGPSGSGKSTLMHLLGMMSNPSSGTVEVFGQSVSSMADNTLAEKRNKTLGFLFQQFFLIPQLSVFENILLPTEYNRHTAGSEFWGERADELIARFGLSEHKDKRPAQLSGGQRQRVALCRALIVNPDVLMCDEPTGALDSVTAEEVLNTLVSLNESGTTVIVITHDPNVAERARRVVRIADGQITEDSRTPNDQRHRVLLEAAERHPSGSEANAAIMSSPFLRLSDTAARIGKSLFVPTLQSLMTQRLRTLLTMTGLLIGVSSIFIMLTLTGQINQVFKNFFETQGSRKAFVSFDWRAAERTGAPRWRGLNVIEELPLLNKKVENYGRIDATLDASGCTVLSRSGNATATLAGVNSLLEARESALVSAVGRLPLPNEFAATIPAPKIALLGSDAAIKLFPERTSKQAREEIIEQTIIVRGCSYEGVLKIIGILEPQDSLFDRDVNSAIYVPTSTLLAGGVSPYDRRVVAIPHQSINPTWFAQYVVNVLRVHTNDKFPFRFFASEQQLEKFNLMLGILTGLTLVIGALCTIIGGIGVMNILLVNVHERIQEIGIRKAVGARRSDINGQFLLESVGLCLLSGVLGVSVGIFVSWLAIQIARDQLPKTAALNFSIDPVALIVALSVSVGAGLLFGTWPARRAAELDIVDALKQE